MKIQRKIIKVQIASRMMMTLTINKTVPLIKTQMKRKKKKEIEGGKTRNKNRGLSLCNSIVLHHIGSLRDCQILGTLNKSNRVSFICLLRIVQDNSRDCHCLNNHQMNHQSM
jgi:hypothetical protein